MSLQGGVAQEGWEGLGRHRWVPFSEALRCVGRLGGDSEGALMSHDPHGSRDSAGDSCVPFTVPVQSEALQCPLQSGPQACRKLPGFGAESRAGPVISDLVSSALSPPLRTKATSRWISLCPPFPRRQSSEPGSPLNYCDIYCRIKEWGRRGLWSQLGTEDKRRLTGQLGLVLRGP